MKVDTGASVSVMAKSRLLQLLPSVPVQPSQVFLRSYSGKLNKVQGKADVHVKFHDKEADLPIFLAGDGSPTLLGRNWMQELGNGVSDVEVNIHALSDVKNLVQDYAEVFQEGLGTFKGATASLHVPSDAPPRFFKPRPLPYALTDGVTQEIQRLKRDSIIVPVKTARWAAPIVPVTKRDGRIRICGDFGVTINPVATVERYPIPRIQDLWTLLAGDSVQKGPDSAQVNEHSRRGRRVEGVERPMPYLGGRCGRVESGSLKQEFRLRELLPTDVVSLLVLAGRIPSTPVGTQQRGFARPRAWSLARSSPGGTGRSASVTPR
ncbi:hypothetical protein MTO96_021344 [Rhipicephalus appendiculatus]